MRSYSALALLLFCLACGKNSETGRQQLNLVSDSEMNTLGEEAYAELLNSSSVDRTSLSARETRDVAQRIAAVAHEDFAWEVSLIRSDDINAFCLPGGKMGVYTGILPTAQTNAGLAAIIGHEVAHASLRHSAERMSQDLLLQAGLALTSLGFTDSPYKNLIAGALGLGAQYGVSYPFNRLQESEADRIGLRYMAEAGYDPRAAIGLWERMGALSSERPPEFLSTHPDPASRAEELKKHMDEAVAIYLNSAQAVPTAPLSLR